ncbi:MAG: hypothetical protein AAF570_20145, partial [Bacteroidota bacterium]
MEKTVVSSDSSIWIQEWNVQRWKDSVWIRVEDDTGRNFDNDFAIAPNGDLWRLRDRAYLANLQVATGNWVLVPLPDDWGAGTETESLIAVDANGTVWLGVNGESNLLARWDGSWTLFDAENSGFGGGEITYLGLANGQVIVSDSKAGIQFFDGQSDWTPTGPRLSPLGTANVPNILKEDEGLLVLADGLYRFSDGDWETLPIAFDLGDEAYTFCARDSTGAYWVVSKENQRIWKTNSEYTITFSNSDLPFNIWWIYWKGIEVASDGTVYVMGDSLGWTRGGQFLASYDGNTWKRHTSPLMETGRYYDMITDKHGHVWLSGTGGLLSFDGENFRKYTHELDVPDLPILQMTYDAEQDLIWCATEIGILRFDYLSMEMVIPGAWRGKLTTDNQHRLWAYYEAGRRLKAFDFRGNELASFAVNDPSTFVGNMHVLEIQVLENGDVAFATNNSGLVIFCGARNVPEAESFEPKADGLLDFEMYPNPVVDWFRVVLKDGADEIESVNVYDSKGRHVFRKMLGGQTEVMQFPAFA